MAVDEGFVNEFWRLVTPFRKINTAMVVNLVWYFFDVAEEQLPNPDFVISKLIKRGVLSTYNKKSKGHNVLEGKLLEPSESAELNSGRWKNIVRIHAMAMACLGRWSLVNPQKGSTSSSWVYAEEARYHQARLEEIREERSESALRYVVEGLVMGTADRRVITFKQLAAFAQCGSPAAAAAALYVAENPKVPRHRVVKSDGSLPTSLADNGINRQIARLGKEGIFQNPRSQRINLNLHQDHSFGFIRSTG